MNEEGKEECQKDMKSSNHADRINDIIESPLSKWKDILAILQSIFTIIGILGALYWFYQQGEARPRIVISHEVTHRQLNEKMTWVHVSVKIKNVGKIPINILRQEKSGSNR